MSRIHFFAFCVVFYLGGSLAFSQAIFKSSPLLRRSVILDESAIHMDSVYSMNAVGAIPDTIGIEAGEHSSGNNWESVVETTRTETARPFKKSRKSLTVTYLGQPINPDSATRRPNQANAVGKVAFPASKTGNQSGRNALASGASGADSLLLTSLEDSLQRLKEQLQPLWLSRVGNLSVPVNLFRTIPSIMPLRVRNLQPLRISSAFGLRVHPVHGRMHQHTGIDFPQPRYTAVYATADGVVDRVVWEPNGIGLAIYLVHPSGYQTGYGHLEDHAILVGETVRRGQLIGRVGSTGTATGPHLHYSVLYRGVPVDPAAYCFLLLDALAKQTKDTLARDR